MLFEKFNIHVVGITEGKEDWNRNDIWRHNRWEFPKLQKDIKPDSRALWRPIRITRQAKKDWVQGTYSQSSNNKTIHNIKLPLFFTAYDDSIVVILKRKYVSFKDSQWVRIDKNNKPPIGDNCDAGFQSPLCK